MKPRSIHIGVRVPIRLRSAFRHKAIQYGTPSEVLRELIEAFVQDRLTILPPPSRKESLYVTRNED